MFLPRINEILVYRGLTARHPDFHQIDFFNKKSYFYKKITMDSEKNIPGKDAEKNKNAVPFEIPVEGSLGLLALGDVGIRAWRKVRDEAKKSDKK